VIILRTAAGPAGLQSVELRGRQKLKVSQSNVSQRFAGAVVVEVLVGGFVEDLCDGEACGDVGPGALVGLVQAGSRRCDRLGGEDARVVPARGLALRGCPVCSSVPGPGFGLSRLVAAGGRTDGCGLWVPSGA